MTAPGAPVNGVTRLGPLFDQFNRAFFRGRLPRHTVRWAPLGVAGAHGRLRPRARTILLARGLPPRLVRQTLLHEMCHIGSLGHGRRFRTKLAHLARMGETWARRERVLCERICRQRLPVSAEIRLMLEVLARDDPELTWAAARRHLLTRVLEDPRQMPPWAKGLWHRLAAAARAGRDPAVSTASPSARPDSSCRSAARGPRPRATARRAGR